MKYRTEPAGNFRRIFAVKEFGCVKNGERGGLIECEDNLSHEGEAWIFHDAIVYGQAIVSGEARVSGQARVSKSLFSGTGLFNWTNLDTGLVIGCHIQTLEEWEKELEELSRNYPPVWVDLLRALLPGLHLDRQRHFVT